MAAPKPNHTCRLSLNFNYILKNIRERISNFADLIGEIIPDILISVRREFRRNPLLSNNLKCAASSSAKLLKKQPAAWEQREKHCLKNCRTALILYKPKVIKKERGRYPALQRQVF